ncbi:MAG: DUF192 domain-containing protein [Bradymonadales bacterium]|nr:DUF192 domain-containing protein [Bradymonadales bacterium]
MSSVIGGGGTTRSTDRSPSSKRTLVVPGGDEASGWRISLDSRPGPFGLACAFGLSFLLLLVPVGCDRPSQADPPEVTGNRSPTGSAESDAATQAQQRWEAAQLRAGQGCTADSDCYSPLRCIRDGSCLPPPAMTGERAPDQSAVLCYARSGEVLFQVELAVDGPQRNRGLMHRPWLLESWGMLFLYPELQPDLSFWMANTYIPLDMVFMDQDRLIVGVIEEAVPLDRRSRSVNRPSQYVLEINAGLARRYGLEAGVRCEFLNLPPQLVPR